MSEVILLAAESLSKLLAVPHQQLLLGLHGPDGVEVDVPAVLAGHQVLLGQAARRVHVTHPVALLDIVAVDEVLKLTAAVNLQQKKSKWLEMWQHTGMSDSLLEQSPSHPNECNQFKDKLNLCCRLLT